MNCDTNINTIASLRTDNIQNVNNCTIKADSDAALNKDDKNEAIPNEKRVMEANAILADVRNSLAALTEGDKQQLVIDNLCQDVVGMENDANDNNENVTNECNFVSLCNVAKMKPKAEINIIGVCKDVGEMLEYKSGIQFRKITLVDTSNVAVNLTLWNDDALNFKGHVGSVIMLTDACVIEDDGVDFSNFLSVLKIDPDIPESHQLHSWFDNGTSENIHKNNNDIIPISQVAKLKPNILVNIEGVCTSVGELVKSPKCSPRRVLTLVGKSNANVNVTLWGEHAINFQGRVGSVISLENGCIKVYRGCNSINTRFDSKVEIKSDTPENRKFRSECCGYPDSALNKGEQKIGGIDSSSVPNDEKCMQENVILADARNSDAALTEGDKQQVDIGDLCQDVVGMENDANDNNENVANECNFVSLSDVAKMKPKAKINIIGVCKDVGEMLESKSGIQFRKITLVDTSNVAVNLTLWNDDALNFKGHVGSVIMLTDACVIEDDGVDFSNFLSVLKIDPDIPESHQLHSWFDNGTSENIHKNNNDIIPISQVAKLKPNILVNIEGVCTSVGELVKSPKCSPRRVLTLVGKSNANVNVTLWGEHAINFQGRVGSVISLENGCIKVYRGFNSINTRFDSKVEIKSDTPENRKFRSECCGYPDSALNKGEQKIGDIDSSSVPNDEKCMQENVILAHARNSDAALTADDKQQVDIGDLCQDVVGMENDANDNNENVANECNFVSLSDVAKMKPKAKINIIGVCKDVGEILQSESGIQFRKITLVDTSTVAVYLTLWNDDALNFKGHVGAVIMLMDACVNEYDGVNFSNFYSVMKIDPDIRESHQLHSWFDNGTSENIHKNNSDIIPISQVIKLKPNILLNIEGVCTSVGELVKSPKCSPRRVLTLVDKSNANVNVTLWGEHAINFQGRVGSVISLEKGCINEYKGFNSINTRFNSKVEIKSDTPENRKFRSECCGYPDSALNKGEQKIGDIDTSSVPDDEKCMQENVILADARNSDAALTECDKQQVDIGDLCQDVVGMENDANDNNENVANECNFVSLSDVAKMKPKAKINIIGVCKDVGEILQSESGIQFRKITLVDTSTVAVYLTLWNDDALNFKGHVGAVIMLMDACVNEYDGVNFSNFYSVMKIDPDIRESHQLHSWFDNGTSENIHKNNSDIIPISQVIKLKPNILLNIEGVCKSVGELVESPKCSPRRVLRVVDKSKANVNVTLWGEHAINFQGRVGSVISLENGYIKEYKGFNSINTRSGSKVEIKSDTPENRKLSSERSGYLTFREAAKMRIDYFQTKGLIQAIDSAKAYYKACPQPNCKAKVRKTSNGDYSCEQCNAAFPNFKYQLLVNMKIGDWTSIKEAKCFNVQAENILQHTANEIGEAMYLDPTKAEEFFKPAIYKPYIFTVNRESFSNTPWSFKVTATTPLDHKQYNKYLCDNLRRAIPINHPKNV